MKLFALAVMLEKRESTYVVNRQMVGYERASDKETAIGRFVLDVQEKNHGFSMGQIVIIEIPPATEKMPDENS